MFGLLKTHREIDATYVIGRPYTQFKRGLKQVKAPAFSTGAIVEVLYALVSAVGAVRGHAANIVFRSLFVSKECTAPCTGKTAYHDALLAAE
jgi:hypothetical protein